MNKLAVAFIAAGLLSFGTFASGESIMSDSFESGDKLSTSAYGFKWSTGSEVTSVVTADTEVFVTSPVNIPAPETSQWEAKTGEHSLMLRYNPGKHWTEQRFSWSEPQPEIWMSFWLRVPTNYSHPEVDGADNQKLFRIWMDGYGNKGEGSTVGTGFRGDGNGGSYFFVKVNKGDYQSTSHDIGKVPFITIPGDRGKWMHFVVHVKSESSANADDGLLEIWRKWEGDSDYTQTHNLQNQPIKLSSKVKGFAAGYLMGYANAAYPVTTEFLVDDFELSTAPLFLNLNAPNAPSGLVIR